MNSRSRDQRNAARVLPDPVGAWMSVWAPVAIASHPRSCAAVGAANDVSNHDRVAGVKRSRADMGGGYRACTTRLGGNGLSVQRAACSPVTCTGRPAGLHAAGCMLMVQLE